MTTTKTIQAMLYPVGAPACRIELDRDDRGSCLAALQRLVGGYIEVFHVAEGMPDLVINDEGLFSQLPNRAVYATEDMERAGYLSQIDGKPVKAGDLYTILYGPIVAVSCNEDGETVSIDADEADRLVSSGHIGGPLSGLIEAAKLAEAMGEKVETEFAVKRIEGTDDDEFETICDPWGEVAFPVVPRQKD